MGCLPSPCSHGMEEARLGKALLIAGHVLELPVPRDTCWPCSEQWWQPLTSQWGKGETLAAFQATVRVSSGCWMSCEGLNETACASQWKRWHIITRENYCLTFILCWLAIDRDVTFPSFFFDIPQDFENKLHHFINFEFTIFIAHWSNYWYTWFHTFHSTT